MKRVVLVMLAVCLTACGRHEERRPAPRAARTPTESAPETQSVSTPAPTPVLSSRVEAPQFTAEITPSGDGYRMQQNGKLTLTVRAAAGYTLHEAFPMRAQLRAPSGMGIAKMQYERADAAASTARSARFDVALRPTQTGAADIDATLSFAVCQGSVCEPREEHLLLSVVVE